MSSQKTLLELPDIEMGLIIEKCDLKSILNLNKTCHHLRNFIDAAKPDIKLYRIEISLYYGTIILGLFEDCKALVTYQKCLYGCKVLGASTEQSKFLENQNYEEIFLRNLGFLVMCQKSVLRKLRIQTGLYSSVDVGFLDRMFEIFEKRSSLIKAEEVDISFEKELTKIRLLKLVDPKSLKMISFGGGDLSEEFVNTEQWKSATELRISDFNFKKFESCRHFTKISADIEEEMSREDILLWKEKFLQSKNVKQLYMRIKRGSSFEKTLGPNFNDELYRRFWFFAIEDPDKVLQIESHGCKSQMSYIDKKDLMAGAVLQ